MHSGINKRPDHTHLFLVFSNYSHLSFMRRSFLVSSSLILMANIFTVDSSQTYNKSSHLFWQLLSCTAHITPLKGGFICIHFACVCDRIFIPAVTGERGAPMQISGLFFFVFFYKIILEDFHWDPACWRTTSLLTNPFLKHKHTGDTLSHCSINICNNSWRLYLFQYGKVFPVVYIKLAHTTVNKNSGSTLRC